MAPVSDRPSAKKQQSLTSFFTPKTVNGLAASFEKHNSTNEDAKSRKRCLDDSAAAESEPTAKKARAAPQMTGLSLPSATADSMPRPTRADRYKYDASASVPAAVPEPDGAEDDAAKRSHDELHRRFFNKLCHHNALPQALQRRPDDVPAQDEADPDDVIEDDESPAPVKTKKKAAKSTKLTPMEVQLLEIKRNHLDTVLIVEVGYKFCFFGEDARIAAKELSIVCIPGKLRYDEHPSEAHLDRFASASIPVHRLSVHAKRLVAAGYKVGVVRQIETAALKKAGDNRNAPFVRKLTSIYTKGTYIDENGELDQPTDGAPSGGYLLCITEFQAKGSGTDEKVNVGILAVQPATGDIIYDFFEDGFMRSELETRLLHIAPCEFLIIGELTKATDKMVKHLSGSSTNVFGDRCRVERVPRSSTMAADASSHLANFYAHRLKHAAGSEAAAALLEKVLKLPEPVTICLSAMIDHLKEYGLEHIFNLTKYFQSFSTRSHMLISGTTLESLEVYRNSTDHSEKGSLFWALNKTVTRFGRRLLRNWVGRPLLDRERLEQRLAAVQELVDKQSTPPVDELSNLLASIKTDLERSLIRIYYGKCTRPELVSVLQTLKKIATYCSTARLSFKSTLLTSAIGTVPQILASVVSYLERINLVAARKDDKYGFFRDQYQTEDMQDHQLAIAHVEHELDGHRSSAADALGTNTLEYATVAGIKFLIEVTNNNINKVPASWSKISGTKKLSRFHTPDVIRLIAERDQHREALAAACDKAFHDLLTEIAADYQPLHDSVATLASLDCLLSLAKVAAQPGYSRPTLLPDGTEPTIAVAQARHPMAERMLETVYIPFTTTLAHPSALAQLVTGPNMGGKSSFVRAFALVVLLAQIGSFVPADSLRLTLCDGIHARTGAHDNLFAGESTFMVELSETAHILRAATPRSLVILDELGRGTSTHDGAAIAHAVLHHIVAHSCCLTLFITHYQYLAHLAHGLPGLKNVHMKFEATEGVDGHEHITFLYEVRDGVAHRSYGLNVARLARIPNNILDVAAHQSNQLELAMQRRRLTSACQLLAHVLVRGDHHQLEQLITSIDHL